MKACLFALVLHIAAAFTPKVVDYFGKKVLEVFKGAACARSIVTYKLAVTDIESGGILMSALLGGIAVYAPQLAHCLRRTEYTRHFYTVVTAPACVERIAEASTDFIHQVGGMTGKIRV